MHHWKCASLIALVAAPAPELVTAYGKGSTFSVESETRLVMETTDFSITRDGEDVDMGGRSMGGPSVDTLRVSYVDEILAAEENGPPHKVKRSFGDVTAISKRERGEETTENERDGALADAVLVISLGDDGEKTVTLEDGTEPDDEEALESQGIGFDLDALLPESGAEVGESWEIEASVVLRTLGLNAQRALFPPAPRDDEGGGRRRRGFGGGRGNSFKLFADAEWEAKATLVSMDESVDDVRCAKIELEFSAAGSQELEESGGGRGGRTLSLPVQGTTEYYIDVEGAFFFSLDHKRPLLLELEGTLGTDSVRERERQDSVMVISITREGTFERTVQVESTEETE